MKAVSYFKMMLMILIAALMIPSGVNFAQQKDGKTTTTQQSSTKSKTKKHRKHHKKHKKSKKKSKGSSNKKTDQTPKK